MIKKENKKLVIIGGGYAGTTLIKQLKKSGNLDITLINETPFHLVQTDIHKYLCGDTPFEEIAFDLETYTKRNNAKFLCSKVNDIDFDNKEVKMDDSTLSYDYLVIATGAKSFFPRQIKNIEEYSQDIKEVDTLKNFKNDFAKLLNEKRSNKNIAIVGGRLSGIEIALEFAQKLKEKNISSDELSISLIEQLPDVLPNMDPYLVSNTSKACDDLGIKRFHGNFVSEVRDNKVFLSNKEEINFDLIFLVIGVSSVKFVTDENVKINVKNQFIVDEYLRLPNHKEVFVLGDVAETKDKEGKYILPTAQMAKLHAKLAAVNILNSVNGYDLTVNDLETKGVMIDLSGKNAVNLLGFVKLKGYMAYIVKRFISSLHTNMFK